MSACVCERKTLYISVVCLLYVRASDKSLFLDIVSHKPHSHRSLREQADVQACHISGKLNNLLKNIYLTVCGWHRNCFFFNKHIICMLFYAFKSNKSYFWWGEDSSASKELGSFSHAASVHPFSQLVSVFLHESNCTVNKNRKSNTRPK